MDKKLAYIAVGILNFIIIVIVAAIWFCVVTLLALLMVRLTLNDATLQGGVIAAALSGTAGLVTSPLSLLPSYKLSLKLAKVMEKKWNVSIPHPARLFALSLLLPIFLLLLAGLLTR